ncbi:MAG: hypothetical protein ACOVSR_13800 [Bacteroidia bacterium]
MKNKNRILSTLIILFTMTCSLNINAQPGSTTTSGDPFGDEPQDVPINHNVLLLTIAGAIYGLKIKAYKLKQNSHKLE